MPKLIELQRPTQYPNIANLIEAYNLISDERSRVVEKIFLLHKITLILDTTTPDLQLTNWRNHLGPQSIENHLQRYNIARDASTLVKNILFATAVKHYAPSDLPIPAEIDYFSALQARNALLINNMPNEETLEQYLQYNQKIMATFDADPELRDKFYRSQYFLSLCYSKMEAIQGVVDQNFSDFNTSTLGENARNNKNFTLNIEGEEKQLVIRVEDRNSLANEQILQTYPVSNYFSEEYYTVMQPFKEGYAVEYQPLVLSEYVEKGALDDYAETLSDQSSHDVTLEIQRVFTLLNDFCLKLIETGHYHPDIKLSNFLTDGQSIKVSDRKTITDKIRPKLTEIQSTPTFAPPEFRACMNRSETALDRTKAYKTEVEMPSFMAYQLGMALKEFMISAMKTNKFTAEIFIQWVPISAFFNQPEQRQKNLFTLVQELTRAAPQDRLSIANFQTLLTKIHLSHKEFLQELEALSPQAQLSHAKEYDLAKNILDTKELTPELIADWDTLHHSELAAEIYADPRINFLGKASYEVKTYLNKIDKIIEDENMKKADPFSIIGSYFGATVPQITRIEELPAIPVMSPKIMRYYAILDAMPTPFLESSDMAKLRHIQERQNRMLIANHLAQTSNSSPSNSSQTTSPADSRNSNIDTPMESSYDSGTLIRKSPVPQFGRNNISTINKPETTHSTGIDSGTFVRKPTKIADDVPDDGLDTGTFVRKPTKIENDTPDERLDTGTFVRKPTKIEDNMPDESLDTGTFVRKPAKIEDSMPDESLDTGTFVRKPANALTSQNTNLDSGSVVRTPSVKQPHKKESTSSFKKRILKTMFTDDNAPSPSKSKPTDITSTIQRGNKKR